MFSDSLKIPIATLAGYAIIMMFALSPFLGFITTSYLDFLFNYAMVPVCALGVLLILLDDFRLRIPRYLLFYIAFALYTIATDVLLVDATLDIKYFYTNRIIGTVLILIIIENTFYSKEFFNTLFKTNHIVLFLALIVIIIQQLFDKLFFVNPELHNIINARSYANTRMPSIYSWVGSAGILGLAFVPMLGCKISHHLKKGNKGVLYLYVMGAIVSFISKSRFIMVNYLILLLLLPIYKGFNLSATLKYGIIVVAFLFLGYQGVRLAGVDVERIISERILEEDRGGMMSGSAGTRILAIEIFSKLYWQNPVFGKGLFHRMGDASEDRELVRVLRGRSSQIHVGYLSLLYYYGIVGGGLFLLFLFQISKDYFQLGKKTLYWGPFFAILQFLLTNVTGVYFHLMIMGMILAMVYARYYQQSLEDSKEEAENMSEENAIPNKKPDFSET